MRNICHELQIEAEAVLTEGGEQALKWDELMDLKALAPAFISDGHEI